MTMSAPRVVIRRCRFPWNSIIVRARIVSIVATASGPSSRSTGPLSHDLRKVQRRDDRRERDPEMTPRVTQDRLGDVARGLSADLGLGCGDPSDESRDRQPRLEAAELAAGTLRPAVGSDQDVPDLPSREAAAEEQAPVQQEAGADTLTDLDEHHVAIGAAEAVLGQHGRTRVVPYDHRDIETVRQLGL